MATMKNEKREPYPRFELDRGIAAEAARRNIEIIVWYKRLISATLGLLWVAAAFTVLAAIFAWRQPLPQLYASGLDGALMEIPYVRDPRDPDLEALRGGLTREQESQKKLDAARAAGQR